MKDNIKCCDCFEKIKHHFSWCSYRNDSGNKIYCMPYLKTVGKMIRINYCPSCGKEVRNIEINKDES